LKISAALGTGLFRNFIYAIIAFYVATVLLIIVGLYAIVIVAGYQNLIPILIGATIMAVLAGIAISKIAVEPLRAHFENLKHFSKETLHELNLPISTITANLSMLKRTHDDEKSRKRLERIESACAMLQERYSELDYLIKKQMQREKIETFDLKLLVEERLTLLRTLYAQVEFEVQLQSKEVTMDRRGMCKVVDNLIDNAVKYSSKPAMVKVVIEGDLLSVTDQGHGMDEVELLGIFERYYQNDSSMPGFGIGLGLVKSYCDRYKIQLHVDSRKGEGTTMNLDFKGV